MLNENPEDVFESKAIIITGRNNTKRHSPSDSSADRFNELEERLDSLDSYLNNSFNNENSLLSSLSSRIDSIENYLKKIMETSIVAITNINDNELRTAFEKGVNRFLELANHFDQLPIDKKRKCIYHVISINDLFCISFCVCFILNWCTYLLVIMCFNM